MGCRALAGAGTPQDPTKAAACRQHGDNLGQFARRRRERAAVRGKGGLPPRPVARAEIPPVLGRSCAGGAPRFRRFRFTCGSGAYFRICKPQRARLWLSGVCCAVRWTAGRGSSSALPAEAVVTAQHDGQRVAALRPLSLRKRRLLRSATDSGSRLFVRPPCGSSVCCAARRTAGRGSSSALPAEAVVTARPAPTPQRRPPRWRAWPEGSCPSAHPASSRASPRPSR